MFRTINSKEVSLKGLFEGRQDRTRSLVKAYASSPFSIIDFELPRSMKRTRDKMQGKRARNANFTQSFDSSRYQTVKADLS